jgi:hypothetical protein
MADKIQDWKGRDIQCARSRGGVCVLRHPLDNLIATGCSPWPTAEIIQKTYQSRQVRAFDTDQREVCMRGMGYYCDLQSIHSEDAITWSVFGTASRSPMPRMRFWVADLFKCLGFGGASADDAQISLWRRVPHPDNLVPGGPEIDICIVTRNAFVLGEAKWRASVSGGQGQRRNKDQIQLRGEYLKKYGRLLFPSHSLFGVFGVGLSREAFVNTVPRGVSFHLALWEEICSLKSHPCAEEVQDYFQWKLEHTVKESR